MNFTKYFIAGKDYILLRSLEGHLHADIKKASALCDRHQGVGADGIFSFWQNGDKIVQISGLLNNGQIMRDFSSASICACFDRFSESHAADITFTTKNEVISEIKCDFSGNIPRIFYRIPSVPGSAACGHINRRTEIGNRILTVTSACFSGLHGVHFSDCRQSLDINYLGRHFSRNSLFCKKADFIIAQKTDCNTYEIDFYENGTGCPRPTLSVFVATTLAAIKTGRQKFHDEINVISGENKVSLICHSETEAEISCEIRKAAVCSI